MRTRLNEAAGLLAAAAIALSAGSAGCGYNFAAADSSALPPSAATIYVSHFESV